MAAKKTSPVSAEKSRVKKQLASQARARRAKPKAIDDEVDLSTVGSGLMAVDKRAREVAQAPRVKRATKRAPKVQVQTFAKWEASRTAREKRVDEIVALMSQGAWLAGVSTRKMAKAWDVNPAVVEQSAAEASRVLRRTLRDDDEFYQDVRCEVLQTFRVVRSVAMAIATSPTTPSSVRVGALGNALQATRLYGFYLGVEPVRGGGDARKVSNVESELDDWTTEQLDHYARTGEKPALPSGDGSRDE